MSWDERDCLAELATLAAPIKIGALAERLDSYDYRLRYPLGHLVQRGLVMLDCDLEYTITLAGREALERTKARAT